MQLTKGQYEIVVFENIGIKKRVTDQIFLDILKTFEFVIILVQNKTKVYSVQLGKNLALISVKVKKRFRTKKICG